MPPADTVTDRIAGTLSCAASDHRVGGILFLDLRPDLLGGLAGWLAAAIGNVGTRTRTVTLGADDTDDSLWWQLGPSATAFAPVPGHLQETPDSALIVLIPDLARANLAVTRAVTVVAGADWAVADRHGLHAQWRPRARWLAACSTADAERLSPHLLDRFPVRVSAAGFGSSARTPAQLLANLDHDAAGHLPGLPSPPTPPAGPPPALSAAAAALVTTLVGAVAAPHRRDLALARAARAVAATGGSATIEPDHVRRAADLLGFLGSGSALRGTAAAAHEPAVFPGPAAGDDGRAVPGSLVENDELVVRADGSTHAVPTSVLPAVAGPVTVPEPHLYPEDLPSALPDHASLRLPWQRAGGRRPTRGPIVGTEPARRLVDIAYLATVLEAAKYRLIRHGPGAPMRIHSSDLRSYRRQPQPDAALVLLLDHTSRRDWDVTAALAPYLGWAYTRRAAVSLVEIGHRDAVSELQAERHRLSGVLDPLLNVALGRAPARATPLAHGLDLAIQEMRLRRRNMPIRDGEAWFVVVSDARGNVPLEASLRNVPPTSVSRAGVDDALTVAAGVAALRSVRAVVLAPPELSHYRDLPFALADAMAGIVARPEATP